MMKNNLFLKIIFILCIVCILTAFVPLEETIDGVYQGDFDFFRRHYGLKGEWNEDYTDRITKGILVHDGYAYISVRDFAKIFEKNIEWDETKNRITLIEKQHEIPLFEKEETAEKIAKAIIEERFPDKVSEKTGYRAQDVRVRNDVFFQVHVMFNTDSLSEGEEIDSSNSDAVVNISHNTWQISSIELWDDKEESYIPIDHFE